MPGMKAKDLGSSGSYSTDWLCGPELVTALQNHGSSDWQTGQGHRGQVHVVYKRRGSSLGVLRTGLVPTNAHPGVGPARVILSECGHGISLVDVKADLQAPRLLQQPEDTVRNLKKQGPSASLFPAMLSLPQFPQAGSSRGIEVLPLGQGKVPAAHLKILRLNPPLAFHPSLSPRHT